VHLPPDFARGVRHIRMRGTISKVNYAVAGLPAFGAPVLGDREREAALSGCVRLCAGIDAMERAFDAAKYGTYADELWIELTVPSLGDPSLAPSGQHVVSACAAFTPYQLRGTTWDLERERLGDAVTRTIEKYAPGFAGSVLARQVITPLDLERTWGLTGGHAFHGELALDQLFLARPLLGWARSTTPIRGLYWCGAGTHPGTGLDGRSGWLAAAQVLRCRAR
jgi:phytoene dehydrogenase-like protein